uniref:Uncharacterized protein n=1 Tax=Arundo donax TaxID=35708 RepID=A0A0A9CAN1_ARUDO
MRVEAAAPEKRLPS